MSRLLRTVYDSTNHYLVGCSGGWLLIDAGWPGRLPALRGALKRVGCDLAEIASVMLTHCHPDHAGLTQEVKREAGARLLIHERQISALDDLRTFFAQRGGYEPIAVTEMDVVAAAGTGRASLSRLGIAGDLIWTPGHSDDSVSLVLDDGAAFIGDLHLPALADGASLEAACANWRALLDRGLRLAYPGHGEPVSAEEIRLALARAVEG